MELRGKTIPIKILPVAPADLALVVLSVFFLSGVLLAAVLLGQISDTGASGLSEFLAGLRGTENGVAAPELGAVLWGILRWPVLLLVVRLTAVGLVVTPVLFCVRGFLLMFSVGAITALAPAHGLTAAFVLFGLSEMIQLPVFFLLGTWGLPETAALWKSSCGEKRVWSLRRCGVCAAALAAAGFLELRVVPLLLSGLAASGMV